MKQLAAIERFCLIGHLVSMAFGLAGILLVMPHPEFLAFVPAGQTLFGWSIAGGGVVYIVLGTIAVAIYAYRTLGLRNWLVFMLASVLISLGSELLGTSSGFPFGDYSYLSGLGYKVAGLVPFTIPLSWFYLGLTSYLLARAGLSQAFAHRYGWLAQAGAILIGASLLTSWDFVLDPAMSQTAMPFWYWHHPGAFFGMPYQNFVGWMATGIAFMTLSALFWSKRPLSLQPSQLDFPLIVYLGNFAFAMIMSLAAGFWVPIGLGILLGVIPAVVCWQLGRSQAMVKLSTTELSLAIPEENVENLTAPVSVTTKS